MERRRPSRQSSTAGSLSRESRAGSTRYGYVVGGVLIIPAQSSAQLSPGFYGIADTGVADDRFDVGVGFQYWGV